MSIEEEYKAECEELENNEVMIEQEKKLDIAIKALKDAGLKLGSVTNIDSPHRGHRIMAKTLLLEATLETLGDATSERVAHRFSSFLESYKWFRHKNSLSGSIENPHETHGAANEKLARMFRQIKHVERNDPKDDWPDVMAEHATGVIIYMIMLLDHYGVDFTQGMIKELNKAAEQHSKKE